MKKMKNIAFSITLLISLGNSTASYSMEPEQQKDAKEFQTYFEECLPTELRKPIILLSFHDAIEFIGLQPIELEGHMNRVSSVTIAGNKVVTLSDDNTAKIWDITTGQLLHTLHGHTSINSIAIDGNNAVTGSEENCTAEIWNIETGQRLHLLKRHTHWLQQVAIAGDKVVTGSADNTVKIWSKNTGELLHSLEHTGWIDSVTIVNDKLITVSDCGIRKIWDINTAELLHTLPEHGHILATSGNKMVTSKTNNSEAVWDINTGQLLYELPEQDINSVAIDGNKMVIGSYEKPTSIWNINTNELLNTLQGEMSYTKLVSISGDMLVAQSTHGPVNVWNINTGQLLHNLHQNTDVCLSVAIAGNKVATGLYDNLATIWSLPNFQGTPDENPLLWIVEEATITQLDLINRAYKATSTEQYFHIIFPKKLGAVEKYELKEQQDARTYFTFPTHVRKSLRSRLNIKPVVLPTPMGWPIPKISEVNCSQTKPANIKPAKLSEPTSNCLIQ